MSWKKAFKQKWLRLLKGKWYFRESLRIMKNQMSPSSHSSAATKCIRGSSWRHWMTRAKSKATCRRTNWTHRASNSANSRQTGRKLSRERKNTWQMPTTIMTRTRKRNRSSRSTPKSRKSFTWLVRNAICQTMYFRRQLPPIFSTNLGRGVLIAVSQSTIIVSKCAPTSASFSRLPCCSSGWRS